MLRVIPAAMAFIVLLGVSLTGSAHGKDAQPASKPVGPSDKQIEKLVKDLDSNAFRTRERAAKELEKAGVRAFDALVKHSERGSLETRMRCFDILAKAFRSSDKRVAAAAKKSLEKLAKSNIQRVAKRAQSVLTAPKKQKLDPDQVAKAGGLQVHRMAHVASNGNTAEVEVKAWGGTGPVRVHVQIDRESVSEIKVDGKRIRIIQNGQGPIEVQVIGKKTKIFTAKDLAELKKRHPEAYELYQKYGRPAIQRPAKPQPNKP